MRRSLLNLLFALTIMIAAASVAAAQSGTCRASDVSTARVLSYVKLFATYTGPARDSVGLTGVDSSTVVAETDSTACARVAQALDTEFAQSGTAPASLVIVRAGARYFAWTPTTNPDDPSGLLHVVDSSYVYRRALIF